ncbi:MAG: hypothetical protein G01um10148_1011 [Parcubacteria group bacterium Gr01-1014_8]|nr:MAG: hypothetical protein G01um10148_1011 [Parcubacteria group bacterium Gr01-1014_8]
MTKLQKVTSIPLLAALLFAGGGIAGYAGMAAAQGADTGSDVEQSESAGSFDRTKGGHVGKNGSKEELLTGETAAKVTAAAEAAVPGATIDRVETDAEGAAYEAHITKADGSHATVKFDTDFNVTMTEDGPRGRMGR